MIIIIYYNNYFVHFLSGSSLLLVINTEWYTQQMIKINTILIRKEFFPK